jgi:hypothetical protein
MILEWVLPRIKRHWVVTLLKICALCFALGNNRDSWGVVTRTGLTRQSCVVLALRHSNGNITRKRDA